VPRRRLVPALLLVVSAAAALSASNGVVRAVEECRLEPGMPAPPGSKWLSRVNRDHRRCWFLSSSGADRAKPRRSATVGSRPRAADADAVQQEQRRNSDQQIASVPANKPDVAVTAGPSAVPQVATPSAEQSAKDLAPHSIPTIAYTVPSPGAQAVSESTAIAARTVQPTPASTGNSNLALLAGAAAGVSVAVGVFQFRRRSLTRSRKRAVADWDDVREPAVVRSSVAANQPPRKPDGARMLPANLQATA
jgi:hypothetical protein